MDILVEQIVKKRNTSADTAKKAGIILGLSLSVVIVFVFFSWLMPINLFVAAGLIYIEFMLITGFDCEYEYIVTNGEIDIDKIIAKRKRKRLLTVKTSAFEAFGLLKDAPPPADKATIVLANGLTEEGCADYYADFQHRNLGRARLIFTPEDKILEGLKPFLPRQLRANLNKN